MLAGKLKRKYAAGACRATCRMPRPPEEGGRDAFSHVQSGKGLPMRLERASHITVLKEFRALRMRAGGGNGGYRPVWVGQGRSEVGPSPSGSPVGD